MTTTPGAEQLRVALAHALDGRADDIVVFETIDSTNAFLMAQPAPAPGAVRVCAALGQTAGRGRRGRQWLTPPGQGVCLSVAWRFADWRTDLATVPLAAGVAACRALHALGAKGVGLKWPNDLVCAGGKLGGLLAECRAEGAGAVIVIGIGLNLELPAEFDVQIGALGGQPPRDLRAAGVAAPDLLEATAALARALADMFSVFVERGFEPYRAEWTEADCLLNLPVTWEVDGRWQYGTARGIDGAGALQVDTPQGETMRLVSGEVTVRQAT
jgi:BirA family biotin operon repressor/biotin-[acetyl-CoA-carboxylase] ligase